MRQSTWHAHVLPPAQRLTCALPACMTCRHASQGLPLPSHSFTGELLRLMHGLEAVASPKSPLNPYKLQRLLVDKIQRFSGFDQQVR